MNTRKHLPLGGLIWYILINIMSLGIPYFTKLVIMKAIIDSQKEDNWGA